MIKYLRRVKGITRKNRIKTPKSKIEVEIESISKLMERMELSGWSHLQRMIQTRSVQKGIGYREQAKRKTGMPILAWNKVITETLILSRITKMCASYKQ